ncbi:MAG: hypothetical protein UY49_C0043G0002 [Microgenomates group bacterium GW2011_GWC1_49_7]|nr:MAG: hypothetical protein UY49_C0043G0002 [Microgenomates group bacterium GW2011_GWC1_49_7]
MTDDHVKKTIAVYDAIADQYASKLDDYAPRPEQDKFISLLPKSSRILDAGCGPGRDCEYFFQHGLKVIGVDLSEKLLAIAKKRVSKVKFLKQDIRKLEFPASSFDGIWTCASLLHLRRDEILDVLCSFYSLLKKNGVLFVLVKEGKGEADIAEKLSSHATRHFTYFAIDELKRLLEKARFVVEEIYLWNEEVRRPGRRDLVWISCFARKIENPRTL